MLKPLIEFMNLRFAFINHTYFFSFYTKAYFLFCFFCFPPSLIAQEAVLKGQVSDEQQKPIALVNLSLEGTTIGTSSNEQGFFEFKIPANRPWVLLVSYAGLQQRYPILLAADSSAYLPIVLKNQELKTVEIKEKRDSLKREEVSLIQIDPSKLKAMPSAFGDFNMILATLGARSNSELSSAYSVRGGSYDENLVYVNDMMVYRPFLMRSGQQEGLSFVNPDLVGSIEFSTGGWQPKYGDKLSSVLDIQYRKPQKLGGTVSLGILNSTASVEGASKDGRLSFIVGLRRKSARYLLASLPVQGQYLPEFLDAQAFVSYKLSSKLSLDLLLSWARNRYLVRPEARQTDFGTFNQRLRLFVAFEGQEQLNYDMLQNALKLTYRLTDNFNTKWIVSYMNSAEREYTEVEGGYRLCEVNSNFGTPGFNDCATIVGIGTNYESLRNRLNAQVIALENRSEWQLSPSHQLSFGFRYTRELINDILDEFRFIDSADFVRVTERQRGEANLSSNRLAVFMQHRWLIDSSQTITYGARLNYWDLNQEWLFSPSLQYSLRLPWQKDMVLRAAVGLYVQPPFYRELRRFDGSLNLQLRAQQAMHYIVGLDYVFQAWGRNFRLLTEAYYKDMFNVVPYDLDNVRLRYYARNDARAYAYGFDARLHGEFIPNTESWFSVSYLKTEEDVGFDEQGYVRRPTDQRLTFGVYFEDHLPQNPTWRMNLNMVWGTGFPFNVPNEPNQRAVFQSPDYRRVDIGFSKYISDIVLGKRNFLQSLWIGADILNLLGVENVISYTWVQDVNLRQYAVPNALSARFLNLRIIGKF